MPLLGHGVEIETPNREYRTRNRILRGQLTLCKVAKVSSLDHRALFWCQFRSALKTAALLHAMLVYFFQCVIGYRCLLPLPATTASLGFVAKPTHLLNCLQILGWLCINSRLPAATELVGVGQRIYYKGLHKAQRSILNL